MMDLHCCETAENEIKACVDKTLLADRVLKNIVDTEETYVARYGLRPIVRAHHEIKEPMITIVGEWMMEVCEEQKCQDEVFLLAMNYMYRFLSIEDKIKKNQLQLLGATCMLIASKLREPSPLNLETLVFYTDYSITKDMLTKWELLVLSKLQWDIVTIVPVDFLPHLLMRLPIESVGIPYEMVKNHAKILIALCAKEYCFAKHQHQPSLTACASIVSALCGLGWVSKYHQSLEDLLNKLQELTSADKDIVRDLVRSIDAMVKNKLEELKDNSEVCQEVPRPEEFTPPPGKLYDHKTATTPTDVHDVHF